MTGNKKQDKDELHSTMCSFKCMISLSNKSQSLNKPIQRTYVLSESNKPRGTVRYWDFTTGKGEAFTKWKKN